MFVLQQAPDFPPTRESTRHNHEPGRRPMLTYRTLTRSAMVLGCAGLIASCGSSPAGQNRRPGGNAVPIQTTGTKRITVQRQVDLAGTLLAPTRRRSAPRRPASFAPCSWKSAARCAPATRSSRSRPRELALALERAESALRQTRAQLGMPSRADGDTPPPDEQIGSVSKAMANRDDARASRRARRRQLTRRGLLSPAEMQRRRRG